MRESPTFARFDTVVYGARGVLSPQAGTIELWMRPDSWARYIASGTFVDAGGLSLSVKGNVLSFTAEGLTVSYDLTRAA